MKGRVSSTTLDEPQKAPLTPWKLVLFAVALTLGLLALMIPGSSLSTGSTSLIVIIPVLLGVFSLVSVCFLLQTRQLSGVVPCIMTV